MSKGRQLNRHYVNKAKSKASNRWLHIWGLDEKSLTGKRIGMDATTPCMCSCTGCGNPRKHFGNALEAKTIQERRCA